MLPSHLWTLPASLLALIANFAVPTTSQEHPDLLNHPRDVKYFPEHANIERRERSIQQRLLREKPIGVKKMSGDPGEKFYFDFWIFEEDTRTWTNESLFAPYSNSFPVHIDRNTSSIFPRYFDPRRLSVFQKRDYQCPSGTNACISINRPNSCCAAGSTCQLIQDSGLGDVGCCPAEETCGGSVSECGEGFTSCPSYPGGGCCVPGYGCFDVGCVQTSTQVIAPAPAPSTQLSTITVTSLVTVTASGGGLQTLTTTVIVAPPPPSPTTSNEPPPPPPPSTTTRTSTARTTTTRSPTATTCPTDFRQCPESLGGGCCHTDRACGSGQECPALSTSGPFIAPARPTDDLTTTTFSTIPGVGCPTGFYACSAYYEGGCCQIDRNCDKTSCPTLASTTVVNSSPTIVAPTGSGITAPGNLLTGACANGWATCAQSDGGGCCPDGYSCGPTQCTATGPAGGTNVAGKIAPNGAGLSKSTERLLLWLAFTVSSMALGLGILL